MATNLSGSITQLTGTWTSALLAEDLRGDGTAVLLRTNSQASSTASITSSSGSLGAGGQIRSGGPGRLCRVVVTSGGITGAITFYDNANGTSGTALAVIISGGTALGQNQTFVYDMPYVNGLSYAITTSGSLSVTASYY